MLQIMVALVIYMVLVIPMGTYLYHITMWQQNREHLRILYLTGSITEFTESVKLTDRA